MMMVEVQYEASRKNGNEENICEKIQINSFNNYNNTSLSEDHYQNVLDQPHSVRSDYSEIGDSLLDNEHHGLFDEDSFSIFPHQQHSSCDESRFFQDLQNDIDIMQEVPNQVTNLTPTNIPEINNNSSTEVQEDHAQLRNPSVEQRFAESTKQSDCFLDSSECFAMVNIEAKPQIQYYQIFHYQQQQLKQQQQLQQQHPQIEYCNQVVNAYPSYIPPSSHLHPHYPSNYYPTTSSNKISTTQSDQSNSTNQIKINTPIQYREPQQVYQTTTQQHSQLPSLTEQSYQSRQQPAQQVMWHQILQQQQEFNRQQQAQQELLFVSQQKQYDYQQFRAEEHQSTGQSELKKKLSHSEQESILHEGEQFYDTTDEHHTHAETLCNDSRLDFHDEAEDVDGCVCGSFYEPEFEHKPLLQSNSIENKTEIDSLMAQNSQEVFVRPSALSDQSNQALSRRVIKECRGCPASQLQQSSHTVLPSFIDQKEEEELVVESKECIIESIPLKENMVNQNNTICELGKRIDEENVEVNEGDGADEIKNEESSEIQVEVHRQGSCCQRTLIRDHPSFYSAATKEAITAEMLKSNKKNVVRNLMRAFKQYFTNRSTAEHILAHFFIGQKAKDVQTKFKRYFNSRKFNHQAIKQLVLHEKYGPVFNQFLKEHSSYYLEHSSVKTHELHEVFVDYLLLCYKDIDLLDRLETYSKLKNPFQ